MRGRPFVFRDLQGGFDPDALSQVALPIDGRARQAMNVVARESGGVRKRFGFTLFSTVPAAVTTLAYTSTGFYVAFTATDIYSIDDATGAVVDINVTGITSSRWATIDAPVVGGQGPFYAMNGVDAPRYWTGAGNVGTWTATAGTLPTGNKMIYHGNRVWVVGGAINPGYRLSYSSIGDPRDWSSTPPSDAGFVDIEPTDGLPITALGSIGNYLLVFKHSKVYLITDLNDPNPRALTDAVGCSSSDRRSVVETPYGTVFLAPGKANSFGNSLATPYITNGQTVVPLEPRLDFVNASQPINVPQGYYINGHYYLGCALGDPANPSTFVSPESGVILDYDFRHKSWWKHMIGAAGSGRTAVCMAAGSTDPLVGTNLDLMMVENGTGKVFKAFDSAVRTDEGASFYWEYTTPFHALKNQFVEKRIHELRVDGRGPVNVACAAFPADPLVAASEVPYETQSATDPSERVFYTPCDGRMVSVRFSDSSSVDAEVDGYAILADYRER